MNMDDEVLRLVEALETAGFPYAVGGAIALGYHATPRGTHDIDVNVFVPMSEARTALACLRSAGVVLDVDAAAAGAATGGDAVGFIDGIRVDLFFDSIPLHAAAVARRRRVNLRGRPIWILSAEDLAVLKLFFDRPKDHLDVEQMVAAGGESFDRAYVRDQLVAHLGPDDLRLETLRAIYDRWPL